ncbi:MAG: hypothetical protein ACYCU8_00440 [Ferrimicrobium acidiphilum]
MFEKIEAARRLRRNERFGSYSYPMWVMTSLLILVVGLVFFPLTDIYYVLWIGALPLVLWGVVAVTDTVMVAKHLGG